MNADIHYCVKEKYYLKHMRLTEKEKHEANLSNLKSHLDQLKHNCRKKQDYRDKLNQEILELTRSRKAKTKLSLLNNELNKIDFKPCKEYDRLIEFIN